MALLYKAEEPGRQKFEKRRRARLQGGSIHLARLVQLSAQLLKKRRDISVAIHYLPQTKHRLSNSQSCSTVLFLAID